MLLITSITIIAAITYAYLRLLQKPQRPSDYLHFSHEVAPLLRISVVTAGCSGVAQIASLLKSEVASTQIIVVDNFEKRRELLKEITHHFGLFESSFAQSGVTLYRSHKRIFSRLIVVDTTLDSPSERCRVGAKVSSNNYTLCLPHNRLLRPNAIESLLLELSLHGQGSIGEIRSKLREPFRLTLRDEALEPTAGRTKDKRMIKIDYKILI